MSEQKMCPVCKQPMNYNAEGIKRNAKAPNWKCSDGGCKFSWNKATKQYEPSDFVTGVWEDQPKDIPAATFKSKLSKEDEDAKWADINFGKCKHAFLVESFKMKPTLENIDDTEAICEEFAKRSMRKLEAPKTGQVLVNEEEPMPNDAESSAYLPPNYE